MRTFFVFFRIRKKRASAASAATAETAATATATAAEAAATATEATSERRKSKRMSSNSKEGRKNSRTSRNTAPGSNKKNHLEQLQDIAAKLLREEPDIRTTNSFDESPMRSPKNKNRHRGKPKISSEAAAATPPTLTAVSILKPWVESTSRAGGQSKRPWMEVEAASPIEIVPVQKDLPPSDSVRTEQTVLCSAFEMLSLEYLCNSGTTPTPTPTPAPTKCSPEPAIAVEVAAQPIKVVGQHSPAHDDGFVIPREIAFAPNPGFCGCASIPRDEELFLTSTKKSNHHRINHKFMKRLLPFKPSSRAEKNSSTGVMKVKVYIDAPKLTLGSNNSIGNSTLTMPKEWQRICTNTSI